MEIAIVQLQNRLLNASWQHGVRMSRHEADPIPPRGMKAVKLALRCIRRARFALAEKVMKSNETAARIWADALAN